MKFLHREEFLIRWEPLLYREVKSKSKIPYFFLQYAVDLRSVIVHYHVSDDCVW